MRPNLQASQVAEVLRRSARALGSPVPNNDTGFGLLDVPAALRTPAPPPDPYEPNDDIVYALPLGSPNAGSHPLTTPTRHQSTITASVTTIKDPIDVYRVWAPPGGTLTATLTPAGGLTLHIWSDQTQTVYETGLNRRTDVLATGPRAGTLRYRSHERRREIVIALLALVWGFNVLGVLVLVASLVSHSGVHLTGRQLLFSGGAVWLTDAIAFGLAFWELDCGGPVARALVVARAKPDFQFPQDENPQLAQDGWSPRLWDYFYVSLTNSIAFSPTDAMPLSRRAKALMAAECMLSAVTVLLVAARAVNILK
jgi:hypothetical protein